MAPEFSLSGPAEACSGGRASFRAASVQDVGRPLSFNWNISLKAGTKLDSQASTLTVWDGINEAIATATTQDTDGMSVYSIDTSKVPIPAYTVCWCFLNSLT